jgi:hypothetical protein
MSPWMMTPLHLFFDNLRVKGPTGDPAFLSNDSTRTPRIELLQRFLHLYIHVP